MASPFPSQNKMSAIVQQASLKRSGLVADCIFPQVKTPCRFDYIDWSNGLNVKVADDAIACKTDVHEVDPEAWTLSQGKVEDHALAQAMDDCCVTACGDDAVMAAKREQGKTVQLMNRLLIAREKRAVALAVGDLTKYTDNLLLAPGAVGTVNEAGRYNLTAANFADPNFALLKWFQPIQQNNFLTGRRTKAIMSQATLNGLLSHPNFLGAGCLVPALTTSSQVAALLGVNEICIADAGYNNGVGATVSMQSFWPAGYILFTASYDLQTSDEAQVAFGISAYDKGFRVNYYKKAEKGPDDGVTMQKQAHDLTEIVLSYKAATLVVIS